MTQQTDMFENMPIDESVLEHLDFMMEDPKSYWPVLLHEIHTLFDKQLKDSGIDSPDISLKLALALGEFIGGGQVYLPRGDALQRQIRNMEIFNQFNGRNIKVLAKHHHLSEKAIYEIIADMRKIEHAKRQPSLF
ncbi:Mor transcription activator family protein [Vibrio nigripulchritudo]|uniref:Mor transcription activator family protein n=1 Tax=Vibrio nigripulchritudo TaxID=28173 RepID=UPI0003B23F31|nr:Mor transcription activator family protein [Vibrio nigripulchritudo]CCN69764.1 putative Middle operon regulator [Vibrio nigripulchritudo SFn118]